MFVDGCHSFGGARAEAPSGGVRRGLPTVECIVACSDYRPTWLGITQQRSAILFSRGSFVVVVSLAKWEVNVISDRLYVNNNATAHQNQSKPKGMTAEHCLENKSWTIDDWRTIVLSPGLLFFVLMGTRQLSLDVGDLLMLLAGWQLGELKELEPR